MILTNLKYKYWDVAQQIYNDSNLMSFNDVYD